MPDKMSHGELGISLIELVLAILILSLGALAAFRVSDTVQRGVGQQEARLLAQQVALNRVAELKLDGILRGRALPSLVEMGRLQWQVVVLENETEIGLVEATIVVTGQNLPGARLVAFVAEEGAP
ncbi:hypothetical protein [Pararhodobacter sp. SW119]|uniref:hypothetical protein n=1 Tax=Pararhodobacter sp. SW119 TaxID=2780075 RepID=UPI001ADEDF48|nr:hypothetical protein [Pararhodobacter sp. SW119]